MGALEQPCSSIVSSAPAGIHARAVGLSQARDFGHRVASAPLFRAALAFGNGRGLGCLGAALCGPCGAFGAREPAHAQHKCQNEAQGAQDARIKAHVTSAPPRAS